MFTCCNGTYARAEDAWQYPWGSSVPGASDLLLGDVLELQPELPCVEAIETIRGLTEEERRWLTGEGSDEAVTLRRRPGRSSDARDLVLCMSAPELHPSLLMTVGDVSALAGITKATVDSYRYRGLLPPPQIVRGRTPLWARPIVRRWVTRRSPPAAATPAPSVRRAPAPNRRTTSIRAGRYSHVQAE